MTGDDDAMTPAAEADATGPTGTGEAPTPPPTHRATTPRHRAGAERATLRRVVTGVAAVAVLTASVFALSASGPNTAQANSSFGPPLPPLRSGPLPTPRPTNPDPVSVGTGALAGLLVSATGKTLYFNDQDTAMTIQCVGSCARVWHPLKVTDAVALTPGPGVLGTLGTIDRPDGTRQVTYNGHPIYTFTIDSVGHVTGDGTLDSFDGVAFNWHAATATGAPTTPSPSSSPPSPAPNPSDATETPTPGRPTETPTPTPTNTNPTHGA